MARTQGVTPITPPAQLNLIVLRSADLGRARLFYETIGLRFDLHRHGSGPQHLAHEQGGVVVEIYPVGSLTTSGTRVGFSVADVDHVVEQLASLGAELHQPAKDSPRGRRAVVRDFDGYSVELTEQ